MRAHMQNLVGNLDSLLIAIQEAQVSLVLLGYSLSCLWRRNDKRAIFLVSLILILLHGMLEFDSELRSIYLAQYFWGLELIYEYV